MKEEDKQSVQGFLHSAFLSVSEIEYEVIISEKIRTFSGSEGSKDIK